MLILDHIFLYYKNKSKLGVSDLYICFKWGLDSSQYYLGLYEIIAVVRALAQCPIKTKSTSAGILVASKRWRRNAWQPLRTCAWEASIIVESYAPCSPLCSFKNSMFYPRSGHHEIEFPITTLCARYISAFCKILATLNFCLSHVFSSQKRFIFSAPRCRRLSHCVPNLSSFMVLFLAIPAPPVCLSPFSLGSPPPGRHLSSGRFQRSVNTWSRWFLNKVYYLHLGRWWMTGTG